jgi:hypothetical protein
MGLFDDNWLGIRPTATIALIPYCEFRRIEMGKIAESALWVDISVLQIHSYRVSFSGFSASP